MIAAFLLGVTVAAYVCGIAFFVFVKRAGANWRAR